MEGASTGFWTVSSARGFSTHPSSTDEANALKIFQADGVEDAIQDPLPAEANAEL